ncbi:Glycine dehydrogenase (decarboxylating) [Trichinella pseudospiralis]
MVLKHSSNICETLICFNHVYRVCREWDSFWVACIRTCDRWPKRHVGSDWSWPFLIGALRLNNCTLNISKADN